MRLRPLRPRGDRPAAPEPSGLSGPVRLDKRTKNLVKRLKPGDVAVIDHLDIDRVAAETLVEKAPVVVVNAAQSISGRYPNAGPAVLVEAGIPLLDAVGQSVFELEEGTQVEIDPDGVAGSTGPRWPAASGSSPRTSASAWTRPRTTWPPPSRTSPSTPSPTSAGTAICCWRASSSRPCGPCCGTGTCWWWSAVTTTRRTCPPCAATSRSSVRP